MRFKWVPEPPDSLGELDDARRAIPLVPASEADCVSRLVDRTAWIDDRGTANEWLTFLRAVGLVEQVSGGYRRHHQELTADTLLNRLCDGVYGARELRDALAAADKPLSTDALVDRAAALPTWERHHQTDHKRVHRRRQRRLADWFVLCGTAEKTPTGYQFVEPQP